MAVIELLLLPAFAILGGAADRLRGRIGGPGSLIYAAILAFAVTGLYPANLWFLPAYLAAFWLGELSGWGYPQGSTLRGFRDPRKDDHRGKKPQSWQFGGLRKDNYLSMLVRGAWWGTPALAVSVALHHWYSAPILWYVPVVMGATMLGAALIAGAYTRKALGRIDDPMEYSKQGWPRAETLRGALTAPALYLLGGVL